MLKQRQYIAAESREQSKTAGNKLVQGQARRVLLVGQTHDSRLSSTVRMVDAVGSVAKIVEVALQIKQAVDTVHQNEEDCIQIGKRVTILTAILSKLENKDTVRDPAMTALHETLNQAYQLVKDCQEEKNIVSIFFKAGKMSKQLRQVNDNILAQMAIANFGNNVQNTIIFTKHFQHGLHPVPAQDPEQMGFATLSHEDDEVDEVSDPQHDASDRLEANDETEKAPAVEEISRIPKIPPASLPWFTIFTYSQLEKATNKFSSVIGEGGFGIVYKGTLRDGLQVAVKRSNRSSIRLAANEYENEVSLAAKLQHIYVMRLLGCCATKKEYILVYQYMPKGALSDHIHGKRDSVLPWSKRFEIVREIAQGALYLHKYCGLRIIHMDLKPSNIFLDDDYVPKIGDFGNSKTLPQSADEGEADCVTGTFGFIAPEYATRTRFSFKNDVYTYGVLLLETISGKRCMSAAPSYDTLTAWAWQLFKAQKLTEFIDPRVGGVTADVSVSETKQMKRCIHIALLCVEEDPELRPTMSDVLRMLSDDRLKLPIPQQPAYTNEDISV